MDHTGFVHHLDALDACVGDVRHALREAVQVEAVYGDVELQLRVWHGGRDSQPTVHWTGYPVVVQQGADSAHQIVRKHDAFGRLQGATDALVSTLDAVLEACANALRAGAHCAEPALTVLMRMTPTSAFVQMREGHVYMRDAQVLWSWESGALRFAFQTVHTHGPSLGQGPWWEFAHLASVSAPRFRVQAPNAQIALAWFAATQVPALLATTIPVLAHHYQLLQSTDGLEAQIVSLRHQM